MGILDTMAGSPPSTPTTAPTPAHVPTVTHVSPTGIEWDEVDAIRYHGSIDPSPEHFLPCFWRDLHNDGVLDLYFPVEGHRSFPMFVSMMNDPNIYVLLFVLKLKGEIKKAIGFASWSPMNLGGKMVGNAGFLFLKDYWDRNTTITACRKGMMKWFTEVEPKLDLAIGINASGNRLVQMFLHRLGWSKMGTIPIPQYYKGEWSDTVIWFVTKEDFLKQEAK